MPSNVGVGHAAASASRRAHAASTSSSGWACAARHSAATSRRISPGDAATAAANRSVASDDEGPDDGDMYDDGTRTLATNGGERSATHAAARDDLGAAALPGAAAHTDAPLHRR